MNCPGEARGSLRTYKKNLGHNAATVDTESLPGDEGGSRPGQEYDDASDLFRLGGAGLAEPRAFGQMLREFPRLTLVLAHMGGATWSQALEIAETYPNAFFDCCEIIEWTGGTNAPSEEQLAKLIQDIGPERVMMGSDFPWYDLDHTVERVMELPLLSTEEKEGILGVNALRIIDL